MTVYYCQISVDLVISITKFVLVLVFSVLLLVFIGRKSNSVTYFAPVCKACKYQLSDNES